MSCYPFDGEYHMIVYYRYRGVQVINLLDCKETGGGGGTCWCGVETLGVIL